MRTYRLGKGTVLSILGEIDEAIALYKKRSVAQASCCSAKQQC